VESSGSRYAVWVIAVGVFDGRVFWRGAEVVLPVHPKCTILFGDSLLLLYKRGLEMFSHNINDG
jgi:hypothetical protein